MVCVVWFVHTLKPMAGARDLVAVQEHPSSSAGQGAGQGACGRGHPCQWCVLGLRVSGLFDACRVWGLGRVLFCSGRGRGCGARRCCDPGTRWPGRVDARCRHAGDGHRCRKPPPTPAQKPSAWATLGSRLWTVGRPTLASHPLTPMCRLTARCPPGALGARVTKPVTACKCGHGRWTSRLETAVRIAQPLSPSGPVASAVTQR